MPVNIDHNAEKLRRVNYCGMPLGVNSHFSALVLRRLRRSARHHRNEKARAESSPFRLFACAALSPSSPHLLAEDRVDANDLRMNWIHCVLRCDPAIAEQVFITLAGGELPRSGNQALSRHRPLPPRELVLDRL